MFFLLVFSLKAQETTAMDSDTEALLSGIFPIGLLLDAAEYAGRGSWQPDWPPDFPPDAFWIATDKKVSVTVFDEENSLSLSWINGHVLEFPWVHKGFFFQVSFDYLFVHENDRPFIQSITLSGNTGENTDIEVLEYFDGSPYLLRIYTHGNYFFAYLEWGRGILVESWYDSEGSFLEQYEYNFLYGEEIGISDVSVFTRNETGRRGFDSRFLLTEINESQGIYSVNYFLDNLPGYWRRELPESGAEILSFQWDHNGLLVRLSGTGTIETADSVFEYIIDERGNWTERREIKMTGNPGLLVPGPGKTYRRLIDYRDE